MCFSWVGVRDYDHSTCIIIRMDVVKSMGVRNPSVKCLDRQELGMRELTAAGQEPSGIRTMTAQCPQETWHIC